MPGEFEFIAVGDATIRMLAALVLCGLLGLERQYRGEPAGLRTHVLVGLGACLFMLLSLTVSPGGVVGRDPARIAAQIVTGIGFLGAGAIFREGATVRGLTTAANVWACAAVGMAAGIGWYFGALLATALMLFALRILKVLDVTVVPGHHKLLVSLDPHIDCHQALTEALADLPVKMTSCEWHESGQAAQTVSIEVSAKRKVLSEVGPRLLHHKNVLRVQVLD